MAANLNQSPAEKVLSAMLLENSLEEATTQGWIAQQRITAQRATLQEALDRVRAAERATEKPDGGREWYRTPSMLRNIPDHVVNRDKKGEPV